MRRFSYCLVVLAVLVLAGAPAFARGRQEVDFLSEFEDALGEHGFSEEQAQAIAEAARTLDWSEGRRADPSLIAEAVARDAEEGNDLAPLEQAQIALELATETVRLRTEGYTPNEVAEVTLAAVSVLHDQIAEWKENGSEEPLGEIVRSTVSDSVRETAGERGEARPAEGRETPADERARDGDSTSRGR